LLNFLERNKKYLIYTPLVIYWMVLVTLTSLPSNLLPTTHVSDKIEHFTAYLILSVLLNLSLLFQNKFKKIKVNAALFAVIFIAVYAALDELHQLFIPGRDCDILDWSADFSGTVIGVLIVGLLIYLMKLIPTER
jgi:VanZ family protein